VVGDYDEALPFSFRGPFGASLFLVFFGFALLPRRPFFVASVTSFFLFLGVGSLVVIFL